MADIKIKDPLTPGKKIKFQVKATFYGEEVRSPVFEIEIPQAISAIRKSGEKLKVIKGSTQNENESGEKQLLFDAYKKTQEGQFYRLSLRVPSTNKLAVNDVVGIIAPSSSPLYVMSGSGSLKRFKVVAKRPTENANVFYVDLRISKQEYDSISPASVGRTSGLNASGNHFIVRIVGLNKKIRYAVRVDAELANGLVNRGNVRDILVFSYRQYGATVTAQDRLQYMVLPTTAAQLVNLKTPPTWEFSQQYLKDNQQITQFGQTFDIDEKNNFAFFVTPVRYVSKQVYNAETDSFSTVWTGEWLQVNEEGVPRWGRALSG